MIKSDTIGVDKKLMTPVQRTGINLVVVIIIIIL
jgi:hypothetical protein